MTLVEFFDYRCPYCKQVEPSLEKLIGVQLFEHARHASMPRRRSFSRNPAGNRLLKNLVRERVLEESASARLTDDAPVEKLVERVADRSFIPPADVPKRVVRESRTDARSDLGGGARLLGELADPRRYQRL